MHVHTAYGEDGLTLHVHTDDGVDGDNLHVHTASGERDSPCRNAGKKLARHRHFHWYSTVSVRHRFSVIRVSLVTLDTD
jgi:hypothetical protein